MPWQGAMPRASRGSSETSCSRTQPRNDRTRSKLPSAANAKRRNLELALDRAVPNWRELNNDPQWLAYLGQTHTFSNCSRQTHLDEAVASGSADRVIAFYRDFQRSQAVAARPAPPPPQWGYRASPRDRPTYTRTDITAAHRAYMKGAYRGREAEYEALQAEFIRAQREGRIVDVPA